LKERTMQLYYSVARRVAGTIFVMGYDYDDKVQECVVKAWMALGDCPSPSIAPLIRTIMRNHLISLSRKFYHEVNSRKYVEDVAIIVKNSENVVIPLPPEGAVRLLLVALLECDGYLSEACRLLGLSYSEGRRTWLMAKRFIRKCGIDACYLERELAWLANYR